MTIELSPPPTSTAKPSEAHTAKTKDKAGAASGKPDASANGFMAILGAIEAAPSTGSDTATDPGASTTAGADASGALLTVAAANAPGLDATTLLMQNPQIAAAMQAVNAEAAAKGVSGSTLPSSLAPVDAQGRPDAALAQDGKGARPMRGAAAGTSQETTAPGLSVAQDSPTQGLQPVGPHAKGAQGAHGATDKLATSTDSNTAALVKSSDSASDAGKQVVDAKFMAALEQAKTASAAKAPEPAFAALNSKPEKSQTERLAGNAKSAEPTYTGASVGVTGPDYSQTAAQTMAVPAEVQVAEQVTYWVSQHVQNAEMKLDGLGQSPVEVSISVQGNEAQIAFRSDEAATRGVLESAGAHLKDMLQREGMVLTGVSVGTSGSGDSGAGGDRRGRQSARQAAIAPLLPEKVAKAPRAGEMTGRSVDLFV
jgi:flagellar hook-length control protein FliK